MTAMEQMILRNVLDGERSRGIAEGNQREHDLALVDLVKRGWIRYRPERTRQRFTLTWSGRAELAKAERAA